jgi:hypothetical protein
MRGRRIRRGMSIDSARASARGMGKDRRARKKVVNNALTPHDPYIHRSSGTGGVWAIDAVNVVNAQAFKDQDMSSILQRSQEEVRTGIHRKH